MGSRGKAGAIVLASIIVGVFAQQAQAATIPVACGNVPALVGAINQANGTLGPDTIDITGAPCTFSLTTPAVVNAANGSTGLPIVSQPLTIEGHGATIARAASAPQFRLLFASGTALTLNDLVLSSGNVSSGTSHSGGNIVGFLANITLNRSYVFGGLAGGSGGGIATIGGELHVDQSLIQFNIGRLGGGVFTQQTAGEVQRSTFWQNGASSSTGGALVQGGTFTFENDTFHLNYANNGLGGIAAIADVNVPAVVRVRSTTIGEASLTNSTAPSNALWVGNVSGTSATATIRVEDSAIVDQNSTAAPVVAPCVTFTNGSIVNEGGNLEWPQNTCGFGTNANPQLASPAPTRVATDPALVFTYRPLPTSPLIDLGGATCPPTDARGKTRPDGEACDSGAYETNPPQTTADGPDGPTNAPSITFSSDEPGSTFQCRVDGAGSFTPCTSPFQPAGLDDGEHTVEVRAVDPEGYIDASPASVTFVVDTTAPVVEITNQPSGPSGTVTFTVADESATTTTCKLDDQDPAPCTSPYAYSGLGNGSHTVVVTATDAAGNTGSDSVTWVVDLTPPETTITGGPSGTVYSTNPTTTQTWTFTSSEAGSTFECRLDDAPFAACTSPHTISGIPPGTHTFAVRAIDAAGNVDPTPATRTFRFQRCNVLQVGVDLFGNPITICL